MFSLIHGLIESLSAQSRVEKVLFVGLDGSGKSNLIENLKSLSKKAACIGEMATRPTFGLSVSSVQTTEPTGQFTLLEVGGSASIRSMWRHYYEEATKIVFLVDGSDASRLAESQQAYAEVQEKSFSLNIPLLLVSNKMDKLNADERLIVEKSISGFGRMHEQGNTTFLTASCTDEASISAILDWIMTLG